MSHMKIGRKQKDYMTGIIIIIHLMLMMFRMKMASSSRSQLMFNAYHHLLISTIIITMTHMFMMMHLIERDWEREGEREKSIYNKNLWVDTNLRRRKIHLIQNMVRNGERGTRIEAASRWEEEGERIVYQSWDGNEWMDGWRTGASWKGREREIHSSTRLMDCNTEFAWLTIAAHLGV